MRVENGTVSLEGPVLASEVENLRKSVRSTAGVRALEDRLEVHERPHDVPGLQGPRRRNVPRRWSPAARLVAGSAGAATALVAAHRLAVLPRALGVLALGALAAAVANVERTRMRVTERGARPAEGGEPSDPPPLRAVD
jgi:hypothetical protein